MNVSRARLSKVLPVLVLLGLLSLLAPATITQAGGEPDVQMGAQGQAACSGYYYTVKPGDTWLRISRQVGAPLSRLKATNPQAVRPGDLIYAGEKLCIPAASSPAQGGYWRQVRPGDTWNLIAREVGVPVEKLWEANPRLVNRRLWLYIGQTVWIPALPDSVAPTVTISPVATEAPAESVQTAQPGQSPVTVTVAATETVSPTVPAPATATPTLAPTETMTVAPSPTATATAPPTETATVAPSPTATPTAPPTATATAAPTEAPTTSPTALPPTPTAEVAEATSVATRRSETPASTATPTTAASPLASPVSPTPAATATAVLPPIPADCPTTLAAYPGAIATYLNKAGNTPDTLDNWLVLCRTGDAGSQNVVIAPITAQRSADVIAVVRDPAAATLHPKGMLLVYHRGARGYTIVHQYEGQGRVELVQAGDVNTDGKFDILYSDTSCGAHTCFATLFVDSWDGKAYADWITGEPTMADPKYTVREAAAEGQGNEILIHGGVIGSVGAGPQRAWTETYISSRGAPYILSSQVYDPSTCLYHKISDANRAFEAWALDGFEPAIEAYKAAIADTAATACGTIKDEVATLRDFARFRLIVADIAAGRAAESVLLPTQIQNRAIAGAATTFLNSYRANTSVIQACRDVNKYAETNPASWQFLADWGYANSSFTAQDLCPLN